MGVRRGTTHRSQCTSKGEPNSGDLKLDRENLELFSPRQRQQAVRGHVVDAPVKPASPSRCRWRAQEHDSEEERSGGSRMVHLELVLRIGAHLSLFTRDLLGQDSASGTHCCHRPLFRTSALRASNHDLQSSSQHAARPSSNLRSSPRASAAIRAPGAPRPGLPH